MRNTQRGHEVGNAFSPKQLLAIELFAIGELNCEQIAAEAKVSTTTISMWRKNGQFNSAVLERAKEILRNAIPNMYSTAVKKAKEGSVAHLEVLLKHIDRLEDKVRSTGQTIIFSWKTADDTEDRN